MSKLNKPRDIEKLKWSDISVYSFDPIYYYYNDIYDCGKGGKFLQNKRLMCPSCKFVFKRHWLGSNYPKIQYQPPKCPHCQILAIELHPSIKISKKNKR